MQKVAKTKGGWLLEDTVPLLKITNAINFNLLIESLNLIVAGQACNLAPLEFFEEKFTSVFRNVKNIEELLSIDCSHVNSPSLLLIETL